MIDYPVSLPHLGVAIARAPIGYFATGRNVPVGWRLAYYHGLWHATKGATHLTAPLLGAAIKAARDAR